MSDLPLSLTAQHWVYVVLIWVGFGTLAGLLASVLFPLRRRCGPFWVVSLGISGSTIGLFGLGWLFPGRQLNPISPLGFLASAIGAFLLLMLFHFACAHFGKPENNPGEG